MLRIVVTAICIGLGLGAAAPRAGAADPATDNTAASQAAPAPSWQERRHWDWGQHQLLAAEWWLFDAPTPRAAPRQRWRDDNWDSPGAPVRIASPDLVRTVKAPNAPAQ